MSDTATVETSIIVRTRNEGKWLGVVLNSLFEQTYADFEIVIVDSGSHDGTLGIARQFPVKIFEIPPQDFSYPYALNYGISRASASRYITILSGHSIPVTKTWLEDGLTNFKEYPNIIGVYALPIPLPDATFWDRFFLGGYHFFKGRITSQHKILTNGLRRGVLGFTNAVIRKDLWELRHFNESYGSGGEDVDWAAYWFQRGYYAVEDERFVVMHSHCLGLGGWLRQFRNWKDTRDPRPFQRLSFRKDKAHS